MSAQDDARTTDEQFAELLQRVIEEGLDPGSQEARHMIDEDMDSEGRIEEAQAVIGILQRSARQERADLQASSKAADGRSETLVREFVAARLSPRAPARHWRWMAAVAAVAAGLLAWLLVVQGDRPASSPEIHLGGELSVILDDQGLRWDFALSPGGWFTASVRDPEAPGTALATSPRLFAPSWPIDPAVRAQWPAVVDVELLVYDGTGAIETVRSARLAR
jgi:hypothetical protein